jgi:mannose-6-phosphate isomerase-like protein (cupin superfamily)
MERATGWARPPAARYGCGVMPYSVVNIDEVEPAGPGGVARFVRRELGVEAFGINWFELQPDTDGFEHDEQKSGQEEVVVVTAGSGRWRIGGDDVPVTLGSFIRIDAGETRQPHAGPDGLTFIAVGCRPGSYEPRGPF